MALLQRGLKNILQKSPNDVVIVSSLRTPITRSYKGGFKDTYPEELVAHVLKATREANPNLDPSLVSDVCMGQVLTELGGAKAGRMALLHAGYPYTTTYSTVNRQCASGLQAITSIAHSLQAGTIEIGIGGGVESMTRNYGSRAIPVDLSPVLKESKNKDARDCIMPMGITSENVAERWGVSRADQDSFAAESHQKAAKARERGWFDEIVPMETRFVDEAGVESQITVSADDGIRPTATAESLAKLKPAFKPDGSSTAGNSSQISDGASTTLLTLRSTATRLGLTPIGKFVSSSVAGVKPDEMGIGPILAIPKLLSMTGLTKDEVDVWELNEAFASQALACVRSLGLEGAMEGGKVNPRGGAIALGHPLGATGARLVAGMLSELKRRGEAVGVVSMCIGTGSGMASLVVRE